MSEPTAADDAQFLAELADVVDPAVTVAFSASQAVAPAGEVAERLRTIAAHLDRIATGSDRPAPS